MAAKKSSADASATKQSSIKEGKKEVMSFGADVGKLISLVAKSLYSNSEIFLRELISNSSDALEKYHIAILSGELEGQKLDDDARAENDIKEITVKYDKESATLVVTDTGVGMSRDDLATNLGTIAKSGTQQFIENILDKNTDASNLIGQFGVGFYSVFMLADQVEVDSVKLGSNEAWRWESEGVGSFALSKLDGDLPFSHGTRVTMHIKPDMADEYLDHHRLAHIIKQYSNHIRFPIMLNNDAGDMEQVNEARAIWTKSRGEITEEEHSDFFKSVAHVGGSPWLTMHNKNEGKETCFTNLLYIPTIKPFDLFHPDRKCNVKLYVKNVFITDDDSRVNLLPRYLRFVKGVVDSQDVPLNVNRDSLQHSHKINLIRASLVKKIQGELKKIAESDEGKYKEFWSNFGVVLKEGLCEALDTEGRESLMGICRFATTTHDFTSLDAYIERMKEGQTHIYYLIGESVSAMMQSPQIEGFVKKGVEVMLLTDSVDDFWTHVIYDYRDKEFKSVTNADTSLDAIESSSAEEEKQTADEEDQFVKFVAYAKEVLGQNVHDVIISKKLTSSPACLAVPEGAFNMRMERFLIDQKQLNQRRAKVLEINKKHPIIVKMAEKLSSSGGGNDELSANIAMLFDCVCIAEGEPLNDAASYSKRSIDLLSKVV